MIENTNNKTPWVSLCIATYGRQEILKYTLSQIQKQSFLNYEVIVSDNDPVQSSRKIVEEMDDERFLYFYNSENVGMVKNFNIALSYARGDFIVMMADDDPPQIDFLQTLYLLWQEKPNFGMYYGASEIVMADKEAAAAYQVKTGSINYMAPVPENTIRCFSKEEFPIAYFENRVFPYMLWSTGIVRREIALEIGGMPDYGSALLTDLSYIIVTGSYAGCATINKIVGQQVVHGSNSGLANPHNIEDALIGSHKYLEEKLSKREDWIDLKKRVEKFLALYIVNHSLAMKIYFTNNRMHEENKKMLLALKRMFKLPGMEKMQMYYLRAKWIPIIKKILYPVMPIYRRFKKIQHPTNKYND